MEFQAYWAIYRRQGMKVHARTITKSSCCFSVVVDQSRSEWVRGKARCGAWPARPGVPVARSEQGAGQAAAVTAGAITLAGRHAESLAASAVKRR